MDNVLNSVKWLPLPDVAEQMGVPVGKIRRLIEDHHLLALRREGVLVVPDALFSEGKPLNDLRGTVLVLKDAGFSSDESLVWLLTPEESLEATPVAALSGGRKTEVRRVAQALA